ncbi:ABC transporter substrate-binding protein [Legionella israelensis]|nr:ABC transporter substrate binding protein [Legionella israelensis]KTD26220.1 ABC transporter substrate binding protein [Legionella israelensis]SCY37547.1 ABC-type uncharacterized transport system, substrate-binding protein [Legionella israelensis DSM 19235]STX59450.1 ABC-type uncharacterized transport system, periplasmic component [Legionella israelensis]
MRIKSLIPTMTGVFLILAFSFLGYQRVHKPRIFILHSYNEYMPWVERVNQGIRHVFKDKAYISLRYFYMDTKRRNSPVYIQRISKAVLAAIHAWKPDVLISFDNDAQNLIGQNLTRFKNTKIIMGGVTDNKRWPEYDKLPNITGITEEIPVAAIREVLSLIFRQERRIYYLSDDSITSRTLEKNMLSQNWGSYELVAHKRLKTLDEWKEAVQEANKTADILLVSVYHSIKDGKKNINTQKLVSWMNENSRIPVVGVYESFIIDGGMIAIAISGLEQGYSAAWLAFNVIEKKIAIRDIPTLRGKTFSLFINKDELRKRFPQAQIPIILDTFSKSSSKLNHLQNPNFRER